MKQRLFVVADVGGPNLYHLGDEAMLEANLHMFRQLIPAVEFTVPSRDPVWTSKNYGVESLDFPKIPPNYSAGTWTQKLGEETVGRLRNCIGLVVSGGGNICDTWPEKVLERVGLVECAREIGIPAVMLGQTLGPSLHRDHRAVLAEPLRSLGWLGVRDDNSAALALELGVSPDRVHKQLDDAFFLEPLAVDDERAKELRNLPQPWILVTLDASFGSPDRYHSLAALASQLDSLTEHLQASLLFVPHVGGADAGDALSDAVAGRALGGLLRSKLLLLGLWKPREVRWLVEQAALVVSTRYHPLVFATAAGVPSLGIHTDDYTRTKLRGALAAAGQQGWCISVADAERGAFLPLVMELWRQRDTGLDRSACSQAAKLPRDLARWDEICRALRLKPSGTPARPAPQVRAIHDTRRSMTTQESLTSNLTEEQWLQYEQKGYLRLGKVLDEPALTALQERMNGIMLGRIKYPTLQMQLDTGGAYEELPEPVAGLPEVTLRYRKVQGLEADPLVLELIRRDLFREICARHYGRHASVSFFRVMLMNKPAGQGTHLPWHQDAGDVWKLDRDPLVTSWIALDPATKMNGCVQVIPGSHRLGLLSKHGSTISQADVERYCPDDAIEYLEIGAGEALLLHNWLLHRSDVNRTGIPRRALSVCYMDGRTLNTLTGNRFPILFGENEDAEAALHFLRGMRDENRRLREMEVMWRKADRYQLIILKSIDAMRKLRAKFGAHRR